MRTAGDMAATRVPAIPLRENIYGHVKRLRWMISHLAPGDEIIEFGCGTGYMITLPLARLGYQIMGVDVDRESIAYGRNLLTQEGLNPDWLWCGDIARLDHAVDVIIASEVFEHIPTDQLSALLGVLRARLRSGGRLLVTAPNGYGWFELESLLWFRAGLGRVLERTGIGPRIRQGRGRDPDFPHPATLAHSPHVQRFTLGTLAALLRRHGFLVEEARGAALFSGPLSNLFFTDVPAVMRLSSALADRFPWAAASFYLACRKERDADA